MLPPVIAVRSLSATRDGTLVDDISLEWYPAQFCAVRGEPGSGKELLLRLLSLSELADSGDVLVEGKLASALDPGARAELRNHRFGFIFAAPFLLPSMTVLENVAMPLFRISHVEPAQARERTRTLLDFIEMPDAAQASVDSLSPFSQHCVSLARALANEPAAVIVEELDGDMTAAERERFGGLLRAAARKFSSCVIAAVPAGFATQSDDRVIELAAGRVVGDSAALRELGA